MVDFISAEVDEVFSDYTVYDFKQAFPSSRFQYLREVYLIEADSIQLMYDLLNTDSTLFQGGEVLGENILLYTPNDYGLATGGQRDLDLVRAKEAWDISTGSSNTIIGVTDSGFELNHEDFDVKIDTIRQNNTSTFARISHGTMVAGVIAASTDNNKGVAGIGFDCKVDLSSRRTTSELLLMSQDDIRVLNSSWHDGQCNSGGQGYSPLPKIISQIACQEIYENNAISFFGAGNGRAVDCYATGFVYPASLDYVMSVSSVGSGKDYGQKSWWYGLNDSIYWNMNDVHENMLDSLNTAGYPASTHNHNHRVDIVAPGYTVNTLQPSDNYTANANGTSFASPMVAGAVGLMVRENPCLTAYQLEYGLKLNAANIYTIPENVPYIGQLGAGRLDAYAAANWASNHPCNDAATHTLFIKGIEINSICQPGSASNGVLPQMEVLFAEGQAPFRYKWEALSFNQSTLDNDTIPNPTIVSSTGSHRVRYRVSVYDSSPIAQKVASKIIDFHLTDEPAYDLSMRDSYMDMLDEPNSQNTIDPRDWNIWKSQDLWNQKTQDNDLQHEDPEYFTTNPNYVYARIRNVGCQDSPAFDEADGEGLRLYWSKASTGEDWPDDWTTTNLIGTGGVSVPGGREITTDPISIPSLEPGEEFIVSHEWYPVAPGDYDSTLTGVDVCFLARIVEDSAAPYGMNSVEIGTVKDNILNNNNIVTRNFIVTDLKPGNFERRHQVLISNAEPNDAVFDLQLISEQSINPHFSGDFSEVGYVTVYLEDIYDRWVDAGQEGTYGTINESKRSITFDGTEPMYLKGVSLDADEKIGIVLEFTQRPNAYSDIPFDLHLRQMESGKDPNSYEEHNIYGSVSFHINPLPKVMKRQSHQEETQTEEAATYKVFPNPVKTELSVMYLGVEKTNTTLSIVDVNGRILLKHENIELQSSAIAQVDISSLSQGIYFILIEDEYGNLTQEKFVKL